MPGFVSHLALALSTTARASLRRAIRLFMDEREWCTRERLERLRSHQAEQEETRRTDR